MAGRTEAMNFSNVWKRARDTGTTQCTPERPASATASAEFWKAFLRQDAKPNSSRATDRKASGSARTMAADGVEGAGTGDDAAPSVEPADIARELGLSRFASVRALQRLRREFALKNHPDRLPSTLHARATKRMMIANDLIDSALKRFQFGSASAKTARPFESGERV